MTTTGDAEVKLSERLEALLALVEPTDDAERDHNAPDAECVFVDMRPAEFQALVEAAAELARAVEDAPCVRVEGMPGTANGFGLMVTSAALVGKRVRIVPEAGQEVGNG